MANQENREGRDLDHTLDLTDFDINLKDICDDCQDLLISNILKNVVPLGLMSLHIVRCPHCKLLIAPVVEKVMTVANARLGFVERNLLTALIKTMFK